MRNKVFYGGQTISGGGVIPTIKANYYKMGKANILNRNPLAHGLWCAGVLIEYDEHSEAKTF